MRLSVIVTVVDGRDALSRCLVALDAQQSSPPMEVLVPYDSTVKDVPAFIARFPRVKFLPMGCVTTMRAVSSAAGQHELFDRRRAAGLGAASGEIIAILEDRGVPDPSWAATVAQLHSELPYGVIGGAIENGCDRLLNWAVYLCDFARYQLPFEASAREYVSDVNVSYKAAAIERTAHLWRDRYHEPVVHDALVSAGDTLFLSPGPIVRQVRGRLSLGPLLAERLAWGRLYGATRVRAVALGRRLSFAALSPLLPALLLARVIRRQLEKKQPVHRLLAVCPLVLVLLIGWSAGEAVGYVTGKP